MPASSSAPAPAPLILELVKDILAIGAVAIQLRDALGPGVERCDKHAILVQFRGRADPGQGVVACNQLRTVVTFHRLKISGATLCP